MSVENKVLSTIYGHGRGWVFTPKDLLHRGSRASIDQSLASLLKKGKIRRFAHGVYYYPKYSTYIDRELNPGMRDVAAALARKFNWDIQPSGPTALNALHLSTQVPARLVYKSDGPSKTYTFGKNTIQFKHAPTKESKFKYEESKYLVNALKYLGKDRYDESVKQKIMTWLDPAKSTAILNDTKSVTGWIRQAIQEIAS